MFVKIHLWQYLRYWLNWMNFTSIRVTFGNYKEQLVKQLHSEWVLFPMSSYMQVFMKLQRQAWLIPGYMKTGIEAAFMHGMKLVENTSVQHHFGVSASELNLIDKDSHLKCCRTKWIHSDERTMLYSMVWIGVYSLFTLRKHCCPFTYWARFA